MHLMRIGAVGAEKPVARLDADHYVTPPIWLQEGDVMELGIDHLGVQCQTVLGPR